MPHCQTGGCVGRLVEFRRQNGRESGFRNWLLRRGCALTPWAPGSIEPVQLLLYSLKCFHSAGVGFTIDPNHSGGQEEMLGFTIVCRSRLAESCCCVSQPLLLAGAYRF